MNNLSLFFVLIVFSMTLQAQTNVDPQRGPTPLTPGIIDGVVLKEDVISQTKMEYAHVREADYTWAKRVFSRIDAREKMNHTLFFPPDNFIDISKDELWAPPMSLKDINDPNWNRNDNYWCLWTIILQNIMLGRLTVYNPEPDRSMIEEQGNKMVEDGYSFKYPIISIKNEKNYFQDINYRKEVNKLISSGSSKRDVYLPFEYVIVDKNDEESTLIGDYTRSPDSLETFLQWKDRLINKGDENTIHIDPKAFEALGRILKDPIDSIKFYNVWNQTKAGQKLKKPPSTRFISSSSITAYNIKEDWYFDKNRSKLERRIIAIAPVGRYNADTTNGKNSNGYLERSKNFIFLNHDGKLVDATGDSIIMNDTKIVEKEIFWLYFDELRDVLVNYYVYNEKSDAQFDSFDDLFIQRRFSATAYKTSDKFDREIEDYKFGVDRLYEAERIKEEIRKWEQDVWNY